MEAVEEQTGGRVKVTPYYAESLGKALELVDNVNTGVCDIAMAASTYYAGLFPVLAGSLNLPGLIPNRFVSMEVLYTLWNRGLMADEFADYKLLFFQPAPVFILFFPDKKVTTLEDLEGMKIRQTGPGTEKSLKALGAVPVFIPSTGELPMSVQTGVIEGAILPPTQVIMLKFYEVFKYALWEMSMGTGTTFLIMTRDKWESFPPDIQLVMEQLNNKAKYQYIDIIFKNNPSTSAALSEVGLDVYTLSPSEKARWLEKLAPVYDEWVSEMEAQGVPGEEVLETVKQVLSRASQ
jgi:TRAP-type C4-dicarboxylate transport system substrate-binding protein